MDAVDRYASEAFYQGARVERLLVQRAALEEALDEAEFEIQEWKRLCRELLCSRRSEV